MPEVTHILIVGESPILRAVANMLAKSDDFTLAHVSRAGDAESCVTTPACVLTDPANAPMALHNYRHSVPVVVCGHELGLNAVTNIMRAGAADYLEWPMGEGELCQRLHDAVWAGHAAHT